MNNEFFQAITWAYLLYILLPICTATVTIFVLNKVEERKHRKMLDELRTEEEAELARLKARLETK